MLPTRKEVELCNPGPWGNHSRMRCKKKIWLLPGRLMVFKLNLSIMKYFESKTKAFMKWLKKIHIDHEISASPV